MSMINLKFNEVGNENFQEEQSSPESKKQKKLSSPVSP